MLAASPAFAQQMPSLQAGSAAALTVVDMPAPGNTIAVQAQFQYERPRYGRRNDGWQNFGRQNRGGRANRTTTIRELPNGCQIVTTRVRRWDGSVDVRRMRRC
jgi:hypothetical protein